MHTQTADKGNRRSTTKEGATAVRSLFNYLILLLKLLQYFRKTFKTGTIELKVLESCTCKLQEVIQKFTLSSHKFAQVRTSLHKFTQMCPNKVNFAI